MSASVRYWSWTIPTHDADEAADERERLAAVAGVRVHLAAARLLLGEDDLVPQPFEHRDRRLPRLGEQRVVQTGDEEGDPHSGGTWDSTPMSGP
jgi:hypothetical protein